MAHRAAPAPALPGDDDRLGSLADRCNPQSILARTFTIRRLKLARGGRYFKYRPTGRPLKHRLLAPGAVMAAPTAISGSLDVRGHRGHRVNDGALSISLTLITIPL